jgi:hypothetical protein
MQVSENAEPERDLESLFDWINFISAFIHLFFSLDKPDLLQSLSTRKRLKLSLSDAIQ